ncbi:hypothetical protein ABW365_25235 [Enterococcus avium]
MFMAEYFLEVYDVYEWPFELDQKMIFTTVARLNENFDLKLNFLQKTEFAFLIAVSLIRQNQGFLSKPKRNLVSAQNLENYTALINDLMLQCSVPITQERQTDLIQTIFWYDFAWDNLEECAHRSSLSLDAFLNGQCTGNHTFRSEPQKLCFPFEIRLHFLQDLPL